MKRRSSTHFQSERSTRKIHSGQSEPIFEFLPQTVLENFRKPTSENALVWNLIYRLASPSIPLQSLLQIKPLWGTVIDIEDDDLLPYFWGFSVQAEPFPGLVEVLRQVDGKGPATEIDLLLSGERNLIVVEAKNLSSAGRCSRYARKSCPEIYDVQDVEAACRYWDRPASRFDQDLRMGTRPQPGDSSPPCNQHYQLARTFRIGQILAQQQSKQLHLWMIVPGSRWPQLEGKWLDFAERIKDSHLWRRGRVLAWEDIQDLKTK